MAKQCSKCKEVKDETEFGRRNNSKDGLCGTCKKCQSIRFALWRNKHKDQLREKRLQKYWSDPEKYRQKRVTWAKNNSERAKAISKRAHAKKDRFEQALYTSYKNAVRGNYKPCCATVDEVRAAFTGKCEICGVSEQECTDKLHLEHDHETGVLRGFVCRKHNAMLGFASDSEEILEAALDYLRRNRTKQTI